MEESDQGNKQLVPTLLFRLALLISLLFVVFQK